jgi:hypothetical protein
MNVQVITTVVGSLFLPEITPAAVETYTKRFLYFSYCHRNLVQSFAIKWYFSSETGVYGRIFQPDRLEFVSLSS